MSMIERVARAIASSMDEDNPRFVRQTWEQMTELARMAMRKRARAALEAMCAPTVAMIDAAEQASERSILFGEDQREDIWRVMVEAALEE